MSLLINPDIITAVLLADGWHEVDDFYLDSYKFGVYYENHGDKKLMLFHGGGSSNICATGFQFQENGKKVSGPLTSILAVRT